MIKDDELIDLKEANDKKDLILEESSSINHLSNLAKEAKDKISHANSNTNLEVLETEIIKAEQAISFAAKYAVESQVKQNFKALQDIIEDEPTYQVYESPNGAKLVRTSGTENKDRLTALNTFFKYNLKTPESTAGGANHLHINGLEAVDNLMSNLLRGSS